MISGWPGWIRSDNFKDWIPTDCRRPVSKEASATSSSDLPAIGWPMEKMKQTAKSTTATLKISTTITDAGAQSLNLRLYVGAPVQSTQQLVNNITSLRFRYYDEGRQ